MTSAEMTVFKVNEMSVEWEQEANYGVNELFWKAHLFQSDDELVDLNDVVIYSGCPVFFEVVHMASGGTYIRKERGYSTFSMRLLLKRPS